MAIRLTESRLRQIIREEIRGIASPRRRVVEGADLESEFYYCGLGEKSLKDAVDRGDVKKVYNDSTDNAGAPFGVGLYARKNKPRNEDCVKIRLDRHGVVRLTGAVNPMTAEEALDEHPDAVGFMWDSKKFGPMIWIRDLSSVVV